jgi:hypothetical protein
MALPCRCPRSPVLRHSNHPTLPPARLPCRGTTQHARHRIGVWRGGDPARTSRRCSHRGRRGRRAARGRRHRRRGRGRRRTGAWRRRRARAGSRGTARASAPARRLAAACRAAARRCAPAAGRNRFPSGYLYVCHAKRWCAGRLAPAARQRQHAGAEGEAQHGKARGKGPRICKGQPFGRAWCPHITSTEEMHAVGMSIQARGHHASGCRAGHSTQRETTRQHDMMPGRVTSPRTHPRL